MVRRFLIHGPVLDYFSLGPFGEHFTLAHFISQDRLGYDGVTNSSQISVSTASALPAV